MDKLDEMTRIAQENGEYDPPFDNPLRKDKGAIELAIEQWPKDMDNTFYLAGWLKRHQLVVRQALHQRQKDSGNTRYIEALDSIEGCISDILALAMKNGVTALAKWKFEDDVKTIRQALRQHQKDNGWRPIETAPKDGTEIIITNGFETYTGKYKKFHITNYAPYFCKSCDGYELNDGHDWQHVPIYMHNPTHWQPLPPTPQTAENKDE